MTFICPMCEEPTMKFVGMDRHGNDEYECSTCHTVEVY